MSTTMYDNLFVMLYTTQFLSTLQTNETCQYRHAEITQVKDKSPARYGVWRHLSPSQLSNWPAESITRELISQVGSASRVGLTTSRPTYRRAKVFMCNQRRAAHFVLLDVSVKVCYVVFLDSGGLAT